MRPKDTKCAIEVEWKRERESERESMDTDK